MRNTFKLKSKKTYFLQALVIFVLVGLMVVAVNKESEAQTPTPSWTTILSESKITPQDVLVKNPNISSLYPAPVVGLVSGVYARSDGSINDQIGAADAGFGWSSPLPIKWEQIDPQKNGSYNFSASDTVVNKITQVGMRPYIILETDKMHLDAYSSSWDLRTPANLTAFANWAAAMANRYKDQGVAFSIWEEPDHERKMGDIITGADMANIITETAKKMKQTAPNVPVFADGSLSPIAFLSGNKQNTFLQNTISSGASLGMFNYIDGFTFHYQQGAQAPERVSEQLNLLKSWISQYSPSKTVPVFNAGAGYERVIGGVAYEDWNSRSLIREHLLGFYLDMPLILNYNYSDTVWGITSSNNTVKYKAHGAFVNYFNTLENYRFIRNLPSDNSNHYYLLFSNGTNYAIVAWMGGGVYTASPSTASVTLSLPAGSGQLTTLYGSKSNVSWGSGGLSFTISQEPKYLIFPQSIVETTTTPTPSSAPTSTAVSTATPTANPSGPLIQNLSTSEAGWAQKTNFQVGNAMYTDRTYTVTAIPEGLAGIEWIQTSNGNKSISGSFTAGSNLRVYVAVDDRVNPLDAWLNGYVDSGLNVDYSYADTSFSLFYKDYNAGETVSLGVQSDSSSSNYIVLVKQREIASVTGDSNADGVVDGKDYVILLKNFNTTTQLGAQSGDHNADGVVDGKDYVILLVNWQG